MELILVVVISAGMDENSQNGVSRSLRQGTAHGGIAVWRVQFGASRFGASQWCNPAHVS